MKTNKIIMLLVLASLVMTLFSCGGASVYGRYDDFDKYTMGGGETDASISEIEIGWLSGEIKILPTDDEKISFSEECDDKTDEKTTMYHRVDGGTLYIHFAASNAGRIHIYEKALTVLVPRDMLVSLDVSTVSASLTVDGVNAREIEVESVSANVDISGADNVTDLSLSGVSGELSFDGKVSGKVDIETVSGGVDLVLSASPREIEAESISANVEVTLPGGTGVTAELDTTSGSFRSSADYARSGDKYVIGDGALRIECDTVSGNLKVDFFK